MDRIKKLNLLVLIVFFTLCIDLQGQWLGNIIPTQTELSQVKKMFDIAPEIIRDDKVLFKLKEGNLFIGLSLGECVNTTWGSWNVEKNIVVAVIFYPKKGRKPSHYKLNSAGMSEEFDSGHKTFTSDEKGLYYSTQFNKLTGIHYYPSNKYENLRCK